MKQADRQKFPWAQTMRFGFGQLRQSPVDFWAMTPRELAAAMRAHGVGIGADEPLKTLRGLIEQHENNHSGT